MADQNKIQAQLEEYLNNLAEPPKTFERGQIIKGNIVGLSKGEMLVDVGGRAEGVVSGKEMKLNGERLEKDIGDEVLVYVIKGENDLGQIELSIRRTGTARKWFELTKAQEGDESLKVQVIESNTGGVIVTIGGGLRGFVPTSQLDNARIYPLGAYTSKEDASKRLQSKLAELIGIDLEVKVIEIDREKNRVIFSEKLVTSSENLEQRTATLEKIKVGDTLKGEVTGIAPFGLFVNAESLEGLVHLSEISWDKVTNPADFHKVGDKVEVQIIGVEDSGKRIAYSLKRLQKDPWNEIVQKYKVGQRVQGEVTKIVDYGAFVRIDDGLNGLIHISELSDKLVKDPGKIVQVGETYELEIISMSREERHLGLSLKRATGKKAAPQSDEESVQTRSGDEKTERSPEMERLSEFLEEDEEDAKDEEKKKKS
ncbi:MAG: 30S ribosomal protein S1 [Candidatus Dojkabacteria bacterium]